MLFRSATSHYFGDRFSRAYGVTFAGRDNKLQYPFQTSWGSTTRMIGAVIMAHGDDNGLVLPPAIAPIQLVILPVAAHKPGVTEAARAVEERLKKICRVKLDDSDNSPGWKFAEYEMKGVPLRLEIGPRDIENNSCVIVRRDNREKYIVKLDELEEAVPRLFKDLHDALYQSALQNREHHTYSVANMDEMVKLSNEKNGFIKAMWCGSVECEEKLKEEAGVSSRCMPFEQEHISDVCVCCGRPAKAMVVWGKAY